MISKLYVKNWKCFEEETFLFTKENIINKPNGWGKTSMFQAIIFALYGKTPAGFNFNSLRLDPNEDCEVSLELELPIDGVMKEAKLKRRFGSSSLVFLEIDGNLITNSIRETYDFIDEIHPYEIVSVLWAPNTLSSSEVLRPNFLINSLLSYIFNDPKKIENHYKRELFGKNKVIKSLENRVTEENINEKIESVQNEIKELKSNIKKRSEVTGNLALAQRAQSAATEIEKLGSFEVINIDKAREYLRISKIDNQRKLSDNYKRLNEERKKSTSDIHKIQNSSVKKIIEISNKNNKCLICNSDWNESHEKSIYEELEIGSIDHNLIDRLEKEIEKIESDIKFLALFKEEDVLKTIKYVETKQELDRSPDWENVLESHQKDNSSMWDKLERLENNRVRYLKMEEDYNQLLKEQKEAKEVKDKADIAKEYIEIASTYYSHSMTEIASGIISKLNPRYEQIFLDEGEYKVSVMDEEVSMINLLPAVQLSSGEKTLVGVALILAAHQLFLPNLPLLFDESFSALDLENILALKDLFKNSAIQTFIITHDSIWLED